MQARRPGRLAAGEPAFNLTILVPCRKLSTWVAIAERAAANAKNTKKMREWDMAPRAPHAPHAPRKKSERAFVVLGATCQPNATMPAGDARPGNVDGEDFSNYFSAYGFLYNQKEMLEDRHRMVTITRISPRGYGSSDNGVRALPGHTLCARARALYFERRFGHVPGISCVGNGKVVVANVRSRTTTRFSAIQNHSRARLLCFQ